MIAGIAIANHAVIATRNALHFRDFSVPVINPVTATNMEDGSLIYNCGSASDECMQWTLELAKLHAKVGAKLGARLGS